jgi:hypothetical protein
VTETGLTPDGGPWRRKGDCKDVDSIAVPVERGKARTAPGVGLALIFPAETPGWTRAPKSVPKACREVGSVTSGCGSASRMLIVFLSAEAVQIKTS